MGCCCSRVEREEMVSRCRARKRYTKQLVRARHVLSATHAMYVRSLRSTGSALLQFSNAESTLHRPLHFPSPPPPPPPPMSPSTDTWTTTTSITASPTQAMPPPPPPPPPSWDFWDPFLPSLSRSVMEEEWEMMTVTAASETPVTVTAVEASVTPTPSVVNGAAGSEMEMAVVSRNEKDLVEIATEVDEYFLKAADAAVQVSLLLEIPIVDDLSGKIHNYGRSLGSFSWNWTSNCKLDGCRKLGEEVVTEDVTAGGSHCSTVERLYAWEKKLYTEVKNAEMTKKEHEKRVVQLRNMEVKRVDYVKTEKTKKEVERLESNVMVSAQAIDTTSAEITKLRESELYPQLLELVKGLMCMWRSMYECHQVQMHIAQQLKYLNTIPSPEPTTEIHRQATLQLELEVQQWQQSFCNLVKAQRDYIQSLTGWLRLSLFQFNKHPLSKTTQDSKIYSLCEEWHLAIDRVPDKVASEGIKSLLTVIHAIVVQQAEEFKQKKKSESAFKELEKRANELRALESKYGPCSIPESASKHPVAEKRAKVEVLRNKVEEEKLKHEKSVSLTRSMTMNNLQMGLPHVFQAVTDFSSVCMRAFESIYNQAKNVEEVREWKRILQ